MQATRTAIESLKTELAIKLKEEESSFLRKDITIVHPRNKDQYLITIKDYESYIFELSYELDDYFGFIVSITCNSDAELRIFHTSKIRYDDHFAIRELGYYIATRF